MCMFLLVSVCTTECVVPSEEGARRGYHDPGNWSYRWLSVVMWVLGTEPPRGQPVLSQASPSLRARVLTQTSGDLSQVSLSPEASVPYLFK